MPNLITGPDALVLMLHEELRSWRQNGITFTLANDGTINIHHASQERLREAQKYRSQHADAIRRYLAFVGDRDPDDAISHLGFAWSLRGLCAHGEKASAMTTEEQKWHSAYWHKLDREEQPLKRRIIENEAEHKELTDKLREISQQKAAEDDGEKGVLHGL